MSRSGVVFSQAYWERAYNLRPGDVQAAGPGQVATKTAPTLPQAPAVNFAEGGSSDAIDKLVDDELADSWQQAMAPLVDPAQALIDQATREGWTAQQLIDRLPDLLAQMDPNELANSLTRASTTARLAGAAGIPPVSE